MSKKSPVKSILAGICALAGCAFFANVAAVFASSRKNAEKLEKHPDANNYMEAVMLQKSTIEIKPDVQYAYITVVTSAVDIIVPRPTHDVMNIDITSVLGRVNIDLPVDVTVRSEGSNHMNYTQDGEEGAPVINLLVKDSASSLTVSFDELNA
jgi:hypothetical protein